MNGLPESWRDNAPPEIWEAVLKVGPESAKFWRSLSAREKAGIYEYHTARKRWETKSMTSIKDVAREVGRNYSTVRHWLKGDRCPKAVQAIESLRIYDGVLVSWPPIRETLKELYLKREMSTRKIAGIFGVNRVTIFQWLKKFGIPLRDRVEAYITAVTKYMKRPFSGNALEAAYMVGLRLSDYDARWAKREGKTVMVRTGTTHPAMIQLAHDVFGSYGGVIDRPHINTHGEYHWVIDCYLDSSFSFLVPKLGGIPSAILGSPQTFLYCLAGLIDGDGWVGLDNCWGVRAAAKIGFCNNKNQLVKDVVQGLLALGYVVKPWVNDVKGRISSYGPLNRDMLQVQLKGEKAIKLLKMLPLRHPEKVMRKTLVLRLHGKAWKDVKPEWDKLLSSIDAERERCIVEAEKAHNARKNGKQALHGTPVGGNA